MDWQPLSVEDIKEVILGGDLRGWEVVECVADMTNHNKPLARVVMQRLGKTGRDLLKKTHELLRDCPDEERLAVMWCLISDWCIELLMADEQVAYRSAHRLLDY